MIYDNHIVEMETALAIKKIQVLGLKNFGGCNSPQEIQKPIEVWRPKTLRGYKTSQN